jgi:hypothetical protein
VCNAQECEQAKAKQKQNKKENKQKFLYYKAQK